MGNTKKFRKTYATPPHPWQKQRIEEEIELTKSYGFRNKKEIYKMVSTLSGFKRQAKKLSASRSEQAKKESDQLFKRLQRLGLLGSEPSYDSVLELSLKDVVERRLQSVLVSKGLARTPRQARQFITHNHVKVKGKTISAPSYLVSVEEEANLTFSPGSALSNEEHPERFKQEKEKVEEELKATKKQPESTPEAPAKETLEEEKASEEKKETPKEEAKEEVKA